MSQQIVYTVPSSPSVGVTPYRSLVRYTAPAVEPVSLAEAKAHCRVDTDDDNAYIQTLITTAREYVEDILDISMITTVWEARYDCFPLWELTLPRPPMQAQTVTVVYRDEGGVNQTITSTAGFQIDPYTTPGRIYPLYNGTWPAVRGDENSVVVRWSAGYGASGTAVPATLKHLCLLLVAHWHSIREPVVVGYSQVLPVPQTFQTLLASSGWGGYR
ncbi:MAG: head-tail connector protein [Phycisphaerales bacterium]